MDCKSDDGDVDDDQYAPLLSTRKLSQLSSGPNVIKTCVITFENWEHLHLRWMRAAQVILRVGVEQLTNEVYNSAGNRTALVNGMPFQRCSQLIARHFGSLLSVFNPHRRWLGDAIDPL